jgi:hypothetical protein
VPDDAGLLGHPQELGVEELDHLRPQQPGPELGQAHVRDPTVVQGQAQRRLPGQVQAAAALSFSVRDAVEQLRQQQRRQHRRRV